MKSKQCLDVQQMQHLQELGMKMDYDTLYRYVKFEDTDWLLKPFSDLNIIGISFKYIPAYTLQDVLDALPKSLEIGKSKYEISIYMIEGKWAVDYYSETDADIQSLECENLIDAVYSRLCWAIENKFVGTNKNK